MIMKYLVILLLIIHTYCELEPKQQTGSISTLWSSLKQKAKSFLKPNNNNQQISPKIVPSISPKPLSSISPTQQNIFRKETSANKSADPNKKKPSKVEELFFTVTLGFFLFVFSFPFLFYNERKFVKQKEVIEKAFKICKVIEKEDKQILENELIFVSDMLSTNQIIRDEYLNKELKQMVCLEREVEMYQYEQFEHQHHDSENNGLTSTSYSYSLGWKNYKIDSYRFVTDEYKGKNDHPWIVESKTQNNSDIKIYDIKLDTAFVDQLKNYQTLPVDQSMLSDSLNQIISSNNKNLKIDNNFIYIQTQPNQDNVGDMRIRYSQVKCEDTSMVGQYKKGSLVAYDIKKYQFIECKGKTDEEQQQLIDKRDNEQLDSGDSMPCCYCCQICCFAYSLADMLFKEESEIQWLTIEKQTKLKMFQSRLDRNSTFTKWLRVLGYVMMILGIVFIFSPFTMLLKSIPFLGPFLGILGDFIVLLFAVIMSLILGTLTIAVAYIYYRPVYAIIVITLMAGIFIYLNMQIDYSKISESTKT